MSQTRNASEETDFGMNEKILVLFSTFLAIIYDFTAKVRQGYANLRQRFRFFRLFIIKTALLSFIHDSFPTLFHTDKFCYLNFKQFCNLHQSFKCRLTIVCAPFGYSRRIFPQLFCQPFVSTLFVSQHYFYSIYVFIHHDSYWFALHICGKDTKK